MRISRRGLLYTISSLPLFVLAQSQADDTREIDDKKYEFFSGGVTSFDKERVTVARVISGRADESKTFLLRPETKIEGKLRVNARVTVGYLSTDDGEIAARIIVRNPAIRRKQP